MADIVDFNEAKMERDGYVKGPALCLHCSWQWEAKEPAGTLALDCPDCKLPKGVWFGLAPPDECYCCPCGSTHFYLHPRAPVCALCGLEHEVYD